MGFVPTQTRNSILTHKCTHSVKFYICILMFKRQQDIHIYRRNCYQTNGHMIQSTATRELDHKGLV